MKHCFIRNERFSWILKVDGKSIPFQGSDATEYFGALYKKMGYEVTFVNAFDRSEESFESFEDLIKSLQEF